MNNANFFSQSFVGSLSKPRNMSLFLSSIFLSTTFYPYLSLNQLLTPNHFKLPWMQQGWTTAVIPFPKKQRNGPSSRNEEGKPAHILCCGGTLGVSL